MITANTVHLFICDNSGIYNLPATCNTKNSYVDLTVRAICIDIIV